MAETQKKEKVEYNLIIDEREAEYLQAMLQNYCGENPDDESHEHNDLRKELYMALKSRHG